MNEPLSFSQFFDQTAPHMLARAVMLCGHRQNAEDAVQEAYAEALKRWPQVGGYESPEAWVYKIMRQRLASTAKHWWSRWAPATPELLELLVPPSATAEETAAARAVLRALAGLPARQRQVLVLHCLLDMPYHQIAAELGLSTGGVGASIAKARRSLRRLLGMMLEHERSPGEPLVSAAHRAVVPPAADRSDRLAAALLATESWLAKSFEADDIIMRRIREAILRPSTDIAGETR